MKKMVVGKKLGITTPTDYSSIALKKYFSDIKHLPLLSKEEELDLCKKIKLGDEEALNKLVLSNLRFVISIAKRYSSQTGAPLEDLISEGNMGLLEAAQIFDYTKGHRFLSFAVFYIRKNIINYLSNASLVRYPKKYFSLFKKVNNAYEHLFFKLGYPPTYEQVAEFLGEGYDTKFIEKVFLSSKNSVSLYHPVEGCDQEKPLIDVIENEEQKEAFEKQQNARFYDSIISYAFSTLNEDEKNVIRLYYGIGVKRAMSIKEIAEIMNMSLKKINDIKRRAIKNLRKNKKFMVWLSEYFD